MYALVFCPCQNGTELHPSWCKMIMNLRSCCLKQIYQPRAHAPPNVQERKPMIHPPAKSIHIYMIHDVSVLELVSPHPARCSNTTQPEHVHLDLQAVSTDIHKATYGTGSSRYHPLLSTLTQGMHTDHMLGSSHAHYKACRQD
jgi:hypothetical protein